MAGRLYPCKYETIKKHILLMTKRFTIEGMQVGGKWTLYLLPRPRRGLRGIVFTRYVCLSVCVYMCVRPIFCFDI